MKILLINVRELILLIITYKTQESFFKMKKILISTLFIFVLTACQTKYLTPEGERLAKNVAAGCVFGEIFFEDCKAGAAVTGAATIIDGQN